MDPPRYLKIYLHVTLDMIHKCLVEAEGRKNESLHMKRQVVQITIFENLKYLLTWSSNENFPNMKVVDFDISYKFGIYNFSSFNTKIRENLVL